MYLALCPVWISIYSCVFSSYIWHTLVCQCITTNAITTSHWLHVSFFSERMGWQSNNKDIKAELSIWSLCAYLFPSPHPAAPLFHLHAHNLYGWACHLMARFYGQIKWRDEQTDVSGESVLVDITIVHIVVWSEWRLWSSIYAPDLFVRCPNDFTVKYRDFKMELESISALTVVAW